MRSLGSYPLAVGLALLLALCNSGLAATGDESETLRAFASQFSVLVVRPEDDLSQVKVEDILLSHHDIEVTTGDWSAIWTTPSKGEQNSYLSPRAGEPIIIVARVEGGKLWIPYFARYRNTQEKRRWVLENVEDLK